MIDLGVLGSVYGVIFVAELPDKTSLASLVLATRYRMAAVFLGACLALSLQSLIAVSAGALFSLLPARPVHLATGAVFIVSAFFMWRRSTAAEPEDAPSARVPRGFFGELASSFVVVFLAEWGDLTQVGTAALAARYRAPLAVFLGSTLALWSVVALVVLIGNRLARVLDPELTKRVAAVIFCAVGLALLTGLL